MTLNAADKTRFLQALDDDPEFLQQVRQRLLSADLLELPERFAAFANHVNGFIAETQGFIAEQRQINERFDQFIVEQREHNRAVDTRLDAMDARFDGIDTRLDAMDARFDGIDTRLNRMDGRLNRMDGRLNRMDGRMDNGFGANYEAKVANNLGSIAGRDLRLRRTRVLKALGFPTNEGLGELIADAEDRGALTEAEANDLLATDLIAVGRSRENGHDVYVAAEVSITVGDEDIERAAERAEYLGKVTGQATEPAVVGESIEPEQEALARQRQVTVMLLPAS